MNVRRLHSSAAVVLLLGTLTGCVTLPPAPREPIGAEARQVIERLQARWREFDSLRTLADVVVQQRGERQQLRGVLLAKAPTSLRFEALSPMGPPLLLAAMHEGHITAYDATTNEGYIGWATAEVTGRLFHLPFEPEDLVAVLAGRPMPPADVRAAELLPPDQIGPSIELRGRDSRRRIWFDPATAVVRQFEITGGRAEARVRYVRTPAGELGGLDLTESLGIVSATVRYQNPAFDTPIPPGAFALTIPKGAKIQEIR